MDITLDDVKETMTQQNTELNLNDGIIIPRFIYTTKRGSKNLVIEVDSNTRKKLLQNKVKMGWGICKVDDYIVVCMYVWPSIHLSAWNNSSPTGGILMMFYI
jgi:hypothetical protein